jgi:predicted phosphodiesterase
MSGADDRVQIFEQPVRRLACLADVHANVAALEAVLQSEEFATADAVAFLGCVTTGPEPQAVLERTASLGIPTYFLAGNGERNVIELADGKVDEEWVVGSWILGQHKAKALATIRSWPKTLVASVEGLGDVRLCHGSPRSDIELFTPLTSAARIEDATKDVAQRVVAHGHTHLQYERTVESMRIIGSGSVGLPYTSGPFGARWAILGPDVELICTPYDIGHARRRVTASGYPSPKFLETLENPPPPEVFIEDCENKLFSD